MPGPMLMNRPAMGGAPMNRGGFASITPMQHHAGMPGAPGPGGVMMPAPTPGMSRAMEAKMRNRAIISRDRGFGPKAQGTPTPGLAL